MTATSTTPANDAFQLIRAGDVAKAAELSTQALVTDPSNPKLWHALGAARLEQGRIAEAIEAFQQRLTVDPSSPIGHYFLAKATLRNGDRAQAQSLAWKAVNLDPSLDEAAELVASIESLDDLERERSTPKTASSKKRTFRDRIAEHDIESGELRRDTYRSLRSMLGLMTLGGCLLLASLYLTATKPFTEVSQRLSGEAGDVADSDLGRSFDAIVSNLVLVVAVALAVWILLTSLLTRYQIYEHWVEVQSGILIQRRDVIFWYEVDNIAFSRTIFDRLGDTATLILVLERTDRGRWRWFSRSRGKPAEMTVVKLRGLGSTPLVRQLFEQTRSDSLHQSFNVKDKFL